MKIFVGIDIAKLNHFAAAISSDGEIILEPLSTSYMWLYTSGSDDLPKIVLYEYQPGRGGIYQQQFLKGFKGLLQCDGYQGYNKVEDVLLACCMAHCRRKFFEALPAERKKTMKLLDINSPEAIKEPEIPQKDLEKYIPAEIGVAYCNKLFYLEREFKDLSFSTLTSIGSRSSYARWYTAFDNASSTAAN